MVIVLGRGSLPKFIIANEKKKFFRCKTNYFL
jgi:hypothetical protein